MEHIGARRETAIAHAPRILGWLTALLVAGVLTLLAGASTATAQDVFPYWVKTIREAPLWDGADAQAKSRVTIPAGSYFAVTAPASKGRLPVVELNTQRNGFLNSDDVEKGAPPPDPTAANPTGPTAIA